MIKYLTTFLFISFAFLSSIYSQPESYYSEVLAEQLNGITEYKVDGGRIDILTHEYAIEVKRASEWKHSIGQALWYGLQTNRSPGIILIMKTQDDYKHGLRLQSALNYGGLNNVKVWFYPQDFGGTLMKENIVEKRYLSKINGTQETKNGCTFWINTGSNKKTRHNTSCRWYNNTKQGRCTNIKEGSACGKCGG
jgi:hypothetical protein